MAITSSDIHNQSFSIDRKGYDVDEVDVFLEHVADEIDALNAQIEQLEDQLDGERFDGFDKSVHIDEEGEEGEAEAEAPVIDEALLAEKDARIADLEHQLEVKKADDNAISQALIVAQRSADEIVSKANAEKASTIKEAEDEAKRILDKAEADKKKVLDAIKKLEDDREDAREEYKDLLSDFITDATRKLAEIGEKLPAEARALNSAHGRLASTDGLVDSLRPQSKIPATLDGTGAYATSAAVSAAVPAVSASASSPIPTPATGVEKDLSGFGDADGFEFEDID